MDIIVPVGVLASPVMPESLAEDLCLTEESGPCFVGFGSTTVLLTAHWAWAATMGLGGAGYPESIFVDALVDIFGLHLLD